MMTVGISLKQLFQLCSDKYLKSEPSKFKAVNKVCLCFLCQDDLARKEGRGLGDTEPCTFPRICRNQAKPSWSGPLQAEEVGRGRGKTGLETPTPP